MNVHDFAAALQVKFNETDRHADVLSPYVVTVKAGRKFAKVFLEREGDAYSGRIHAFVEIATGHVFKPAGLNAPAKGVRFTDMAVAVQVADPFGSYLYAR